MDNLQTRAARRYLVRHPFQCALAVFGVALGTAMVVAIELAQNSARASFADSLVSVFGQSTHRISNADRDIPENTLAIARRHAYEWSPAPEIEASIGLQRDGDKFGLMLYGFDPFSVSGAGTQVSADLSEFLTVPRAALMNSRIQHLYGIIPGDSFTITYGGRAIELELVGSFEGSRDTVAGKPVIAVDIATAQEILLSPGRLSRISLTAPPNASQAVLQALSQHLPLDVEVRSHGRQIESAQALTEAFNTNLDALALLALVVGGFMIYNTMSYLVAQRQSLFARLRAIGASRWSIARQVMCEGWTLASIATLIGCALGFLLASLLLEPLSTTLGDHYFQTVAPQLRPQPGLFAYALVMTFLVCSVATALPAWRACSTPPVVQEIRSTRMEGSRRAVKRVALCGACSALLGCCALALSERSLHIGFLSLGLVVVGLMLVAPFIVDHSTAALYRLSKRTGIVAAKLGIAGARAATASLAPAIAAIVGAVATSIGIGLMVSSFRIAVADWLEQLLKADIYVSGSIRDRPLLNETDAAQILADPRVAAISKVRRLQSTWRDHTIRLTAYDLPDEAKSGFHFVAGNHEHIWSSWDRTTTAIVSEPFSWHHQTRVGDHLEIATPAGNRDVEITGIYRDYGNEHGVVALDWQTYSLYWRDTMAHGFGVYTTTDTAVDALAIDIDKRLAAETPVSVWSNANIKAESMKVFDRTFVITSAITLLATIIAALGVFNALLALNMQQRREHAVLRAIGIPVNLMRHMLYCQNGVISVISLVLAIPLGVVIAWLLIEIINVRSFGWSMTLSIMPPALLTPVALALALTAAASVYPVEMAARASPADHLDDD